MTYETKTVLNAFAKAFIEDNGEYIKADFLFYNEKGKNLFLPSDLALAFDRAFKDLVFDLAYQLEDEEEA